MGGAGPLAELVTPVIQIAADREIADEPCKGTQPDRSVGQAGGPVGVRDNAHLETLPGCLAHDGNQEWVEKKGLASLEIDRFHSAQALGLLEEELDLRQGHRAGLPGAAPDETMVALECALVGE
jgi:hypothetical protein